MVTAVVVADERQHLTPDDVIATVKAQIGSVSAPKRVEFVDALPTTPVGKVDKKAIRAEFWAGRERMVG
jgi:fatty-acyl-CoA synthase